MGLKIFCIHFNRFIKEKIRLRKKNLTKNRKKLIEIQSIQPEEIESKLK
jgi:hypothetical protein